MTGGLAKPGSKIRCHECGSCTNCGSRTAYDGKWFCGDSCKIVYIQKQEKDKIT